MSAGPAPSAWRSRAWVPEAQDGVSRRVDPPAEASLRNIAVGHFRVGGEGAYSPSEFPERSQSTTFPIVENAFESLHRNDLSRGRSAGLTPSLCSCSAVTFVPVSKVSGQAEADDVLAAVRPTTCLVTVMLANNETGVVMVSRFSGARGAGSAGSPTPPRAAPLLSGSARPGSSCCHLVSLVQFPSNPSNTQLCVVPTAAHP